MLKDWQGFSIKEIAEILDISEDNVKVNIFRAKVKLKELKSQL
jgi:RNA polymerase sigma-70 factor (ECF subfamily)